jgi:hypothetical protein
MKPPDLMAAMLERHPLDWGTMRLTQQFGCSRCPMKCYLAEGGCAVYHRPQRPKALDAHCERLEEPAFSAQRQCRRRAPGRSARGRDRGEPAYHREDDGAASSIAIAVLLRTLR